MPITIIDRLPISPEESDLGSVSCGRLWTDEKEQAFGQRVIRKANQPLVWISLLPQARSAMDGLPKPYARVPALLDTGCSAALCLSRRWFEILVGTKSKLAPMATGRIKTAGGKFECVKYGHWKLWLHRNRATQNEPHDDNSAVGLFLESVAVHEQPGLSYPCIGMPLLTKNNLHFHINGARRQASLVQDFGLLSLQPGEVVFE